MASMYRRETPRFQISYFAVLFWVAFWFILGCLYAFAAQVEDIAPGSHGTELEQRIAAAPDGTTFRFLPGTHRITQTLDIARGHVALVGEEGARIVLAMERGDGIAFRGPRPVLLGRLQADAEAGAREVTVEPGHGFKAGDVIYMQQRNTREWLDSHGWTNISMDAARRRPFRETMHVVESVDGARVRLATPLAYALEAGLATFHSVALLEGVRAENLTITHDFGRADANDFTNPHPVFTRTHALIVSGTRGAVVRDVRLHDTVSTAFTLHASIRAEVEDLTVERAHNKGGGGNGYGVQLSEAFDNRLTGLTILGVRHGLILSAWNAEVGNHIEILRTDRDTNLHGSPDHSNTLVIHEAVLDYGASGRNWMVLAPGARNHALTDFAANDIRFARAVGDARGRAERHDVLHALDDGAFLSGGLGRDRLVGGRGADVIVGGAHDDVKTGGAGADTFVVHPGAGADRITDFGANDRLVLSGLPAPRLIRTIEGMRVESGDVSVLLEGVTRLEAEAIVLDAEGAYSAARLGV